MRHLTWREISYHFTTIPSEKIVGEHFIILLTNEHTNLSQQYCIALIAEPYLCTRKYAYEELNDQMIYFMN